MDVFVWRVRGGLFLLSLATSWGQGLLGEIRLPFSSISLIQVFSYHLANSSCAMGRSFTPSATRSRPLPSHFDIMDRMGSVLAATYPKPRPSQSGRKSDVDSELIQPRLLDLADTL